MLYPINLKYKFQYDICLEVFVEVVISAIEPRIMEDTPIFCKKQELFLVTIWINITQRSTLVLLRNPGDAIKGP